MILAGDVGGTKCSLGLFAKNGPSLRSVFQSRLATRDYSGFEDLIGDFLERAAGPNRNARAQRIEAAGFGLAGVVVDGSLHAGNLPWVLNGNALARKLHLNKVVLLNDLIATALSLDRLGSNDFAILNQGTPEPNATKAVIAAGTGLGEAILFWDGQQYRVAPAEGGQADFTPRTEVEIQLLTHLNKQLTHVSCEEVISGRGFLRIHEFLDPSLRHPSFDSPGGDAHEKLRSEDWRNLVQFAWRRFSCGLRPTALRPEIWHYEPSLSAESTWQAVLLQKFCRSFVTAAFCELFAGRASSRRCWREFQFRWS